MVHIPVFLGYMIVQNSFTNNIHETLPITLNFVNESYSDPFTKTSLFFQCKESMLSN